MKTFQKAQEIFKNQLNKPINRQIKDTKSSFKNRFNLDSKIYKIYLYNKFCIKKLNKTNILKNYKKQLILLFTKLFFLINKGEEFINKRQSFKKLKNLLKQIYFIKKNNYKIFQENYRVRNLQKTLKLFLIDLKFLMFYYFFEKQTFYKIKIKKALLSFKNKVRLLNYKFINNLTFHYQNTLRPIISLCKDLLRTFILDYTWSNEFIKSYGKRLFICIQYYSLPFLFFLNSLLNNLNDRKFSNLLPLEIRKSIDIYSPYILIIYLAAFISSKNQYLFSKDRLRDIGICACLILMSFCLDYSPMILQTLVKSGILVLDIYFYNVFLQGDKKAKFLTKFSNIITDDSNIRSYLMSKTFKPKFRKNFSTGQFFELGRYEKFTEQLLNNSNKFLYSSLLVPFYGIFIIVLLYNCSYYIMYNKYPYIPIITNLVNKLKPTSEKD